MNGVFADFVDSEVVPFVEGKCSRFIVLFCRPSLPWSFQCSDQSGAGGRRVMAVPTARQVRGEPDQRRKWTGDHGRVERRELCAGDGDAGPRGAGANLPPRSFQCQRADATWDGILNAGVVQAGVLLPRAYLQRHLRQPAGGNHIQPFQQPFHVLGRSRAQNAVFHSLRKRCVSLFVPC